MKHLKSYHELNEELTRSQRMWTHLPYLLPGILINRFLGITTLLNYKWSEIKKKTTDSKFNPIFAISSHEISQMKRNLKKITIEDIPENKLGFSMFLRSWNLYLVEGDTHSDSSSKDPKHRRPIVYLSKDEIKTGDYYCGERISDTDVYKDFKKPQKVDKTIRQQKPDDLSKYPIIVMIAKADKAEETIDMSTYIKDICVEIEDDLPVEVKVNFDKVGDELWVNIVSNDHSHLYFSEDLDKRVEELKKTIESFLNSQNYKLSGKCYYYLRGKLWYFGDKGRFPEIRKYGKLGDSKKEYYSDTSYVSTDGGVNVNSVSHRSTTFLSKESAKEYGSDRYQFYIDSDDIRTLISDKKMCSSNSREANGKFNSKTGEEIEIQTILLKFEK